MSEGIVFPAEKRKYKTVINAAFSELKIKAQLFIEPKRKEKVSDTYGRGRLVEEEALSRGGPTRAMGT